MMMMMIRELKSEDEQLRRYCLNQGSGAVIKQKNKLRNDSAKKKNKKTKDALACLILASRNTSGSAKIPARARRNGECVDCSAGEKAQTTTRGNANASLHASKTELT